MVRPENVTPEQRQHLEHFKSGASLLPVLTPLAIDPGHPFPYLANRSLCLVAQSRSAAPSLLPRTRLVVVHLPSQVVPRFVPLPSAHGEARFMRLEDVVALYLPWLYHGYEILSCHAIRVTRDAEIAPQSVEAEDTLAAVESSLRRSAVWGPPCALQYDADLPADVLETLVTQLELEPGDLYPGAGFTAFSDLFQLYGAVDVARLKEHPPAPLPVPAFDTAARPLECDPRRRRPRSTTRTSRSTS